MSGKSMRRTSLEEIKAMQARGELITDREPKPGEELPPGFWEEAEMVDHRAPTSVHLKLDQEVFDFFKSQGKGHITRMQNVLKAYVRAHTQGRR